MRLILHEIELNTKDAEAGKKFYHDLLGLPVHVDQDGLKVFDSGWSGLDLNVSTHNPRRTAISFLTDNLDAFVAMLKEKNCNLSDIYETHLDLRAVKLEDPDGNIIEIQCPTEKSPQFLHDMLRLY
ncbi:MAG: VOC family protein [Phycisphaerae bacterium]|nr:VOC family protein [Phycisphaerae bacterium]